MIFGDIARKRLHLLTFVIAGLATFATPQATFAAATTATPAAAVAAPAPSAPAPAAAAPAVADGAVTAAAPADGAGYTPLGPEWIKGQPEAGAFGFQKQYSELGEQALWMHDWILMPTITAISLLVLVLLLVVVVRFRRSANPVPSKTSHNTLIEIIWTVLPVVILVGIAVPSISLLSRQFDSPPKGALTIKATGYQWYWGFTYPDNGGFEVISNMLPEEEAIKRHEPPHLAADNRMVVPVGEPIRMQVIGSDVIHAFGVPSLWFKIDAVPGRINEKTLTVEKEGIYYGQCMELCGARHGYMPIVIEAVPRPQFEAWIRSKGGTLPGDAAAAPAAAPAAPPRLPLRVPRPPAPPPARPPAAATPAA
jgi:cytochrome c oxidase subunit 2